MKPISQLRAIVFALLILAGADARHALAQAPADAQHPVSDHMDDRVNITAGSESAVVLRFAIASRFLPDTKALSVQACPQPAVDESQAAIPVGPATLDLITAELQKRLSRKMPVLINVDGETIPIGATVFSGCITRFVSGNSAKKMVGFNWGASRVGAHVIVLTKTRSGFSPVDSFDIAVKGGNVLPPLGPVAVGVRVVQVSRETDAATAKKLADQILKKFAKHEKSEARAQERQ